MLSVLLQEMLLDSFVDMTSRVVIFPMLQSKSLTEFVADADVQLFVSSFLADELEYTTDFRARRRLRSASLLSLNVRRTRLSTVSDRAFRVAASRTWNSLPQHVTSAPSVSVSEVVSRLSSSRVPSHDFYCKFCGACAVTVVIF